MQDNAVAKELNEGQGANRYRVLYLPRITTNRPWIYHKRLNVLYVIDFLIK